jgi:anti-anti-sigma factor
LLKRLHQPATDTPGPSPRCRCSTATLSSSAGDIVVLRVAGEVDLDSFAGLDAALDDVLDRRPDHLIVDLTGLVFCSFQGLAAITRTAKAAAANGTRYSMSGASLLIARLWPNYWPNGDAPPIHPTTAAAMLSAIVLQAELWRPPMPPPARGRSRCTAARAGPPPHHDLPQQDYRSALRSLGAPPTAPIRPSWPQGSRGLRDDGRVRPGLAQLLLRPPP